VISSGLTITAVLISDTVFARRQHALA